MAISKTQRLMARYLKTRKRVHDSDERRQLRLVFEQLECRRLLAVDLPPLLDINTLANIEGSSPQNLVDISGTVFFTATASYF